MAGKGGLFVLILSQTVFSDTVICSYSGNYASELQEKQDSLSVIREDVQGLADSMRNNVKREEEAGTQQQAMIGAELAHIAPPSARMSIAPTAMTGTLSPSTRANGSAGTPATNEALK